MILPAINLYLWRMSQLVMFDFYFFVDDFSQKPLFDGISHTSCAMFMTSSLQLLRLSGHFPSKSSTDLLAPPLPALPPSTKMRLGNQCLGAPSTMVVSVSYGFSDVAMNERLDVYCVCLVLCRSDMLDMI